MASTIAQKELVLVIGLSKLLVSRCFVLFEKMSKMVVSELKESRETRRISMSRDREDALCYMSPVGFRKGEHVDQQEAAILVSDLRIASKG